MQIPTVTSQNLTAKHLAQQHRESHTMQFIKLPLCFFSFPVYVKLFLLSGECQCEGQGEGKWCPIGQRWDEELCGCVCAAECPGNQPLNPDTCLCQCRESPQSCLRQGRKFNSNSCRQALTKAGSLSSAWFQVSLEQTLYSTALHSLWKGASNKRMSPLGDEIIPSIHILGLCQVDP